MTDYPDEFLRPAWSDQVILDDLLERYPDPLQPEADPDNPTQEQPC